MSDAKKEILDALNDKRSFTLPKLAWFVLLVILLGGIGALLSKCA